jgi:hypothetical protein
MQNIVTTKAGFLCELCESLALFAVKAFNREERKVNRKGRKEQPSKSGVPLCRKPTVN